MQFFLGALVTLLSLLCWGGQTIVLFAPTLGVALGLSEAETDVEPVFWADVRGEALWDFLTLWTMVVAGVLLMLDRPDWPYFGLVGGGIYVYFAGRGVATRLSMRRRGFRVGTPANLKLALSLLVVWGLMGSATVIFAATTLSSR